MKNWYFVIISLLPVFYQPAKAEIEFRNITDSCGLGECSELGFGTAIVDYNNDNLQDIFIVGQGGHNRLFRNNGDLQFEDITSAVGIGGSGSGWGVCYGDFDSDFDEDIYVSNRDNGRNQFFVYGDNGYVESAQELHVDDPGGYGYAACFAPLTKSLSLDLIVVNQAWSGQRQSCRFFAGQAGGPFINITEYSGLADSSQYWDCASTCNYDNDNDLDLLVSGESTNRLYRNNGHGFFTNISDSARINLPRDGDTTGYGITWGDYNNDGNMDYYISYWHDQTGEMYRNNGDGTFTDVTSSLGLGQEVWCHSVSFGDYNNDGWLDLYTVTAIGGNKLYKNNHGTSFTEISELAGVVDGNYCCGLSVGDLDADGKLDMVVGHYAEASRKAYVYRNVTSNNNNWVVIKINGFPPNPDGIGARVRLYTGNMVQTREVSGGSGFGSQNMLPLHFGMGTAMIIDSLVISYPNTHISPIKYYGLPGNGYYHLPEIVIDVAGVDAISPASFQDYETPINPLISYTNKGTVDLVNIKTSCELITNGNRQRIDSLTLQYLATGDTTYIDYLPYSLPRCRQFYSIEGIVSTNGDQNRQNDTVSTTFYAGYYHDMSCNLIISPHPESLQTALPPKTAMQNVGISSETDFPVLCRIWYLDSLVYSEEIRYSNPIAPLADDTLQFSPFQPQIPGRYKISVCTGLETDSDRTNDTSAVEIEIAGNGCHYLLGDINNSGQVNGIDILYAVRYFKGGNPPPYLCDCPSYGLFYVAGDVNGSCSFNGADITFMVNYFKGGALLVPCPACAPAEM